MDCYDSDPERFTELSGVKIKTRTEIQELIRHLSLRKTYSLLDLVEELKEGA